MEHPRPVLPSQRFSPTSDYTYETDDEILPMPRQPLGESTGNVQAHSLAALALCNQGLSPPIHPIPTPPIIPTQALTSSYGTSLRGGRSLQRDVSLRESSMGYPRGNKNPIYAYKHFAEYRNKVMQKELEKEQPIWPLWLEDAFLDALLLIPQMGRKKFSSKTILYGRNMLITEYLWIYHWLIHPPQNGERIPDRKQREKGPNRPAHPMYRTRKQVSSHIQVLKGFFSTLVTFHFIFPSKKDSKDDDKKLLKEDEDTESFKNNRVLIAIADSRLPDERPNYEYFARLLNADNDVFLRPKQCWIFVSSSQVSLKEKHAIAEDGTTKKQVTGYTPSGQWLGESDYPHLKLNDGKDYKDLPRTGDRPTVLLHEYTRALSQKESSSIKDISNRWDVQFPELKEKLMTAMEDTHPSDERTSRCVVGPCDTFHFEVVLDLHATSKFPDGSELNGMVQLAINRPELRNHSWRSVTSVVKPDELHISGSEEDFWNRSDLAHRGGCHGRTPCECTGPGSSDSIAVPFPAASWANTFIKLAPYVTAERERREQRERETASRETHTSRSRADREAARMKKEEEDSSRYKSSSDRMPTPKDLLEQVAMYQEVWSAAHDGSNGSSKRHWTRRAVIMWTFAPVHDHTDEKRKTVTVPAGTNWRFLTKFDPTSQYHQQHAYLSGSPAVSRDSVMSPNPGYQHHLNAAMHENFSAAYDAAPNMALSGQQQHAHLAGLNLLDPSFGGSNSGLATPPPTATLQSSGYAHSFDGATIGGGGSSDSLHHQLSFMSDGTSGTAVTTAATEASSSSSSGALVGDHQDLGPFGFDDMRAHHQHHPCDPAKMYGLTADALHHGDLHQLVDAPWGAAAGYVMDASPQQQHHGIGVSWADTGALTSSVTAAEQPAWGIGVGEPRGDSISSASHWTPEDGDVAAASLWSTPSRTRQTSLDHQHHQHQLLHAQQQAQPGDPALLQEHADAWWQQASSGRGWDDADSNNNNSNDDAVDFSLGGGGVVSTGLTPLRATIQPQMTGGGGGGRKRARTDSVDGDAAFPVHSMRKLSHHHTTATGATSLHHQHLNHNAPTAIMEDVGQGYL
ncbi:hypothetical protein F4779DRAFT_370608 [Xylariaceae sp. FL0662B]|nr:hypothetical protein F4779DRAFT_370608 [Xylariaceae sp. FL0662B]